MRNDLSVTASVAMYLSAVAVAVFMLYLSI